MFFKKSYLLIVSLWLIFGISGCTTNKYKAYKITEFSYFNTVCEITGFEKNKNDFDKVIEDVLQMLEKYHKLFDIYQEYVDINNICTINKEAITTEIVVDSEIINLIKYSIDMYYQTNGMLNIAMGSVLNIWHEAREYASNYPDKAIVPTTMELENARLHTNIQDIIINEKNNTIYLKDPEMSLDVGAIAKGYTAEKIGEYLLSIGKSSYIVNLGGNIKLVGLKPSGDKWKVGVQNPDISSTDSTIAMLELADYSAVTSGSYQRYYTVDNIRYHHIIDPVSLFPKNDYLSVTIVTKNSGLADALSTALFNISIEEGKKIIEQYDDTYAMWIDSDNKMYYSKGFEKILLGE